MSRKSIDKYQKGRRTAPISEGLLNRHKKTSQKTGIRKHRKQRDLQLTSGGKRRMNKHPRG